MYSSASTVVQNDTFRLETGRAFSHLLTRSQFTITRSRARLRSDLFDVSAGAYLANQHSKYRDYVANYGTRDTIAATMRAYLSVRPIGTRPATVQPTPRENCAVQRLCACVRPSSTTENASYTCPIGVLPRNSVFVLSSLSLFLSLPFITRRTFS